jgi:hypothetical protein
MDEAISTLESQAIAPGVAWGRINRNLAGYTVVALCEKIVLM